MSVQDSSLSGVQSEVNEWQLSRCVSEIVARGTRGIVLQGAGLCLPELCGGRSSASSLNLLIGPHPLRSDLMGIQPWEVELKPNRNETNGSEARGQGWLAAAQKRVAFAGGAGPKWSRAQERGFPAGHSGFSRRELGVF